MWENVRKYTGISNTFYVIFYDDDYADLCGIVLGKIAVCGCLVSVSNWQFQHHVIQMSRHHLIKMYRYHIEQKNSWIIYQLIWYPFILLNRPNIFSNLHSPTIQLWLVHVVKLFFSFVLFVPSKIDNPLSTHKQHYIVSLNFFQPWICLLWSLFVFTRRINWLYLVANTLFKIVSQNSKFQRIANMCRCLYHTPHHTFLCRLQCLDGQNACAPLT